MNKKTDLEKVAVQVKRTLTAQKRKQKLSELPDCPVLLSLNELATKTGLSYSFLRRMIVEERQVPYIQVGTKYMVNYNLFLQRLSEKGD